MSEHEIVIGLIEPERWEAYRAFKLARLKEDPQASHVTYEEEASLPLELWRKDLEVAKLKDKFIHVFALVDGAIVGMGTVFLSSKANTRHAASVVSIHVDGKVRGMGVGHKIMAALIEECRRKGIVKLELTVNTRQIPAINLYLKNGFTIVGQLHQTICVDGVYYDEYMMEKFL